MYCRFGVPRGNGEACGAPALPPTSRLMRAANKAAGIDLGPICKHHAHDVLDQVRDDDEAFYDADDVRVTIENYL